MRKPNDRFAPMANDVTPATTKNLPPSPLEAVVLVWAQTWSRGCSRNPGKTTPELSHCFVAWMPASVSGEGLRKFSQKYRFHSRHRATQFVPSPTRSRSGGMVVSNRTGS